MGSNIRIDVRGNQVMRILPREHEGINEEWLADKGRYAADGLVRQRLDQPYVRRDGRLQVASWDEALAAVSARLERADAKRVAALAGDLVECESIYALRKLMHGRGVVSLDCRQDGAQIDPSVRAGYLFNTGIAGIERADCCLLVGTDLRWRLLDQYAYAQEVSRWWFTVARIGRAVERYAGYPIEELGDNPQLIEALAKGETSLAKRFEQAEYPMVILGQAALAARGWFAYPGSGPEACRAF